MKPLFSLIVLLSISFSSLNAQVLKNILNTVSNKSAGTDVSSSDISEGLKQALQIGTERGLQKLSAMDGFFANAVIKILMPEEAKKVEKITHIWFWKSG